MLSGVNGGSPWAAENPAEGAGSLLECALGSYTSGLLAEWQLPVVFDVEEAAGRVPDEPDVWTDGSLVHDKGLRCLFFGFCFFFYSSCWSSLAWTKVGAIWMIMLVKAGPIGLAVATTLFLVLYRLFRELSSGVLLLLCRLPMIGVDDLGVVRHVGRLLDSSFGSCPAELVRDGDLVLLTGRMLEMRGRDTVRISKVKGHADEDMVREGRVRELGRTGNNAADVAADFGRRRVDFPVIDARRIFSGVCGRWYPVVVQLHRFFSAISRAVVNHEDGNGTPPDPLVWSAGVGACCAGPCLFCLDWRACGLVSGLLFLLLLLLRMLRAGHTLLGSWVNGLPSWARNAGQRREPNLGLVVCHLWKCSFCKNYGLVSGLFRRKPFPDIGDLDAQFQCRLFRLVQH